MRRPQYAQSTGCARLGTLGTVLNRSGCENEHRMRSVATFRITRPGTSLVMPDAPRPLSRWQRLGSARLAEAARYVFGGNRDSSQELRLRRCPEGRVRECPSTSFYGALGIKVVGLGWPSGVERGRVVFPTIPPASDVQQQGVEGLASVSTSGIHGSAVRARKACRSWRRAATTVGSKWEPASLPIVIRACSQVLARR